MEALTHLQKPHQQQPDAAPLERACETVGLAALGTARRARVGSRRGAMHQPQLDTRWQQQHVCPGPRPRTAAGARGSSEQGELASAPRAILPRDLACLTCTRAPASWSSAHPLQVPSALARSGPHLAPTGWYCVKASPHAHTVIARGCVGPSQQVLSLDPVVGGMRPHAHSITEGPGAAPRTPACLPAAPPSCSPAAAAQDPCLAPILTPRREKCWGAADPGLPRQRLCGEVVGYSPFS